MPERTRTLDTQQDLAALWWLFGIEGLFSIVFGAGYSRDQVDAFVDALKVFRIGYSWAGPMSLAVPYDLAAIRAAPAWPGFLVRFSIGLEEVDDLIADCEQALGALGRPAR